jgi:site-specific DNA-adenine methylase
MSKVSRGANYTGNQLEKIVKDRLNELGYTFIHRDKFKPAIYNEQPIYSRQYYIGKSIYETNSYCDFIIYHPQRHPKCLVIETKWQQTGGSVDEKYPYLILNIQQRYAHEVILLLDGGGYKKQAEAWIRTMVGNNLLHVFNMSQFQKWANQGNL